MASGTLNTQQTKESKLMMAGPEPVLRVASWILFAHAALWAILLFRWVTFASIGWDAFDFEEALFEFFPEIVPYILYGGGLVIDLILGGMMLREIEIGRKSTIGRSILFIALSIGYWFITRDFLGAITIVGLAGMIWTLAARNSAWSINFPAAFWLIVFFILPIFIVFVISLSERGPLGTIVYPDLTTFQGWVGLFDDYGRFFSRISGQFIYLQIFWRSFLLAIGNTALCLLLGYPFAYWMARKPEKWRNILVFLVMIPFWTNFLVRTYAWLLLLRDSGLINNVWTSTIHEQAVALAGTSGFFAWLATATENPLPLLFNTGAVFIGLFYGYFPFVVLPLYSNLEKLDWSLLEAASDLGASGYYRFMRVLLPLSAPGLVAAGIIVFVPSLGAYVTPTILGGGKVSLLGNLLQQQFMTTRDWPFGSAIGFLMMAIMLLAILIYFRVAGNSTAATGVKE
ncbi:MAG: spermidine/putrescine transport system permease protein [Cellvibrionaceae bacterium]|jgi:spermidine/putrescine transport system permease protein